MNQSTLIDTWYQPYPDQDTDLLKQLGFIPGLKELLMLRQVHALEHATVWVLSEMAERNYRRRGQVEKPDNDSLGGLSTDKGFYLYGQVRAEDLHHAVRRALLRLQGGEWNLAIHPRCGTNVSVTLMLTAGLVLGAHLILPRGPLAQVIGLGVAASTALQLAPDLGESAQKYLSTSIPFNLKVEEIGQKTDLWGRRGYFVAVKWQESQ